LFLASPAERLIHLPHLTIEQLNAKDRQRVRTMNENYIPRIGIRSVEANVVYSIATK